MRGADVEVVLSTLHRPMLAQHPANWRVLRKVDQQQVLSEADGFVTCGAA